MGYIVRQTVSSGSAAATGNIASVISLKKTASSADAKHVSVTSEALSDPSYSRKKCVHPTAEVRITRDRVGLWWWHLEG